MEVDGEAASGSIQKKAGLQAVFAPALERDALWQAMFARHTYGTTGARMVLLFSVNGVPMGGELKALASERLELALEAGGTTPFSEACIFRFDGRRWSKVAERRNGKAVIALAAKDDPPRSWAVYYARVTQADGETGWTSPVWVDRAP